MTRIEEIKKRMIEYGEGFEKASTPIEKLVYEQILANPLDDIEYLLLRLGKAEKALSDVVNVGKSDPEYAIKCAEASLNEIRE